MTRPGPRLVAGCLGVLAIGTLSACTSTPGNRRVVSDVIESLQQCPDEGCVPVLTEEQERCMLDKLDGYSDDDLDNIADENENWDPESGSTLEEASDSMRRFIADFEECTGAAETASSEPSASGEPSDSAAPTTS